MFKILTIAGSDSSGGAGIQADLKTIAAHRMYGMSVITALTAQNTTGVTAVWEPPPEFVGRQMDAVFTDIFPDAVKIGMVSNAGIIAVIAERLRFYNARNIVVDPVMASTSGSRLLAEDACGALADELFPLARVITPNILESEILCGFTIRTEDDALLAAKTISGRYPCAVLVKGGHRVLDAIDLLYTDGAARWFRGTKIDNPNTHGTGCTLSSALACRLAEGKNLEESVRSAKQYLTGAIAAMLDLGTGAGPLDHMYETGTYETIR